jgi:hypothetical protein
MARDRLPDRRLRRGVERPTGLIAHAVGKPGVRFSTCRTVVEGP